MLRLKTQDKALLEKICREVGFPTDTAYFSAVLWAKKEEVPGQLEPLVFSFWQESGIPILLTMVDRGKYLFLAACGKYRMRMVRAECRKMTELQEGLCIGMGFETDNLMAVSQSCEIALLNAEQSFFDSSRTVFEIEDEIPKMKKLNPGLYAEFVGMIKEKPEQVDGWLHRLVTEICSEGFYRQEDIIMLLSAFARLLVREKSALLLSAADMDTEEELDSCIREAVSIDEVMKLFERMLDAFWPVWKMKAGFHGW